MIIKSEPVVTCNWCLKRKISPRMPTVKAGFDQGWQRKISPGRSLKDSTGTQKIRLLSYSLPASKHCPFKTTASHRYPSIRSPALFIISEFMTNLFYMWLICFLIEFLHWHFCFVTYHTILRSVTWTLLKFYINPKYGLDN